MRTKNYSKPRLIETLLEATPIGRVLRGVAANLYDKGVVALLQLLNIPVLTHYWGADGFGVWLMLTTIPTYVAVSDIGLGTAAGVELTSLHAKGQLDRALKVPCYSIAALGRLPP